MPPMTLSFSIVHSALLGIAYCSGCTLVSSSCQLGAERSAVGAEMSAAFDRPDTLGIAIVRPLANIILAMQLLPEAAMYQPWQCDADRLTKLKSELTAIELWESDYYLVQVHDDIDAVAHRNRLQRGEELLGEIASITRPHARVFRLRYS